MSNKINFKNKQEEHIWFVKAQTDKRIKEQFISRFFYLVNKIIAKYPQHLKEDLFQEGCIGLMIAFDRFDISKNVRFHSYAQWWIKNKISDFLWGSSIVKITREHFLTEGLPSKSSETEEFDLSDILIYSTDTIGKNLEYEEMTNTIQSILAKLDKIDRKILELRYGLKTDGEIMHYKDIGEILGYSKQRIQQLVKKALNNFQDVASSMNINKDLFR